MATEGNAKAMIGMIFIQYGSYATIYLADEFYTISQPHYKKILKELGDKPLKLNEEGKPRLETDDSRGSNASLVGDALKGK